MTWTVIGGGTVSRGLLVFSTDIRPPGEYLITVEPFEPQSYGLWGFVLFDAVTAPIQGASRHQYQPVALWRRSSRIVVPSLGSNFVGTAFSFYFPIGSPAGGNTFEIRRFIP